jgi:hypothetical protein
MVRLDGPVHLADHEPLENHHPLHRRGCAEADNHGGL